jgi:hypothetical protein
LFLLLHLNIVADLRRSSASRSLKPFLPRDEKCTEKKGRRGGGEEGRRGEGEKEKKKVEGRKETMQVV